jgi:hypothetical protein
VLVPRIMTVTSLDPANDTQQLRSRDRDARMPNDLVAHRGAARDSGLAPAPAHRDRQDGAINRGGAEVAKLAIEIGELVPADRRGPRLSARSSSSWRPVLTVAPAIGELVLRRPVGPERWSQCRGWRGVGRVATSLPGPYRELVPTSVSNFPEVPCFIDRPLESPT